MKTADQRTGMIDSALSSDVSCETAPGRDVEYASPRPCPAEARRDCGHPWCEPKGPCSGESAPSQRPNEARPRTPEAWEAGDEHAERARKLLEILPHRDSDEAQRSANARHDPGCDALDVDPAIGRPTKPCNCARRAEPVQRPRFSVERPRAGRVRIITFGTAGSGKDEQVEVDEAELLDRLRSETPVVHNHKGPFCFGDDMTPEQPKCGGCLKQGALEERNAVVAYLRKESDEAGHVMRQHGLKLAADEIGRGEHRAVDEKGTEGDRE